jgi:hypothetical protein
MSEKSKSKPTTSTKVVLGIVKGVFTGIGAAGVGAIAASTLALPALPCVAVAAIVGIVVMNKNDN